MKNNKIIFAPKNEVFGDMELFSLISKTIDDLESNNKATLARFYFGSANRIEIIKDKSDDIMRIVVCHMSNDTTISYRIVNKNRMSNFDVINNIVNILLETQNKLKEKFTLSGEVMFREPVTLGNAMSDILNGDSDTSTKINTMINNNEDIDIKISAAFGDMDIVYNVSAKNILNQYTIFYGIQGRENIEEIQDIEVHKKVVSKLMKGITIVYDILIAAGEDQSNVAYNYITIEIMEDSVNG